MKLVSNTRKCVLDRPKKGGGISAAEKFTSANQDSFTTKTHLLLFRFQDKRVWTTLAQYFPEQEIKWAITAPWYNLESYKPAIKL